MPKLTIYIPPDLMEQIKEHPEVNWSALAQEAYKHHLSILFRRSQWFPTEPIKITPAPFAGEATKPIEN